MTVAPHRLDSVATDLLETGEAIGLGSQLRIRTLVEVAHDVRFAFAGGARTVMPQLLEGDERLCALAPLYGEVSSDDLDVDGPHA